MGVPFVQINRVIRYVLSQRLRRRHRYPLVLMLEPLFRCNLSCAGCGKISYPEEILNRRLSAKECLSSVDECGAPVVSIAGGEPLMHPDMPEIVSGLVKQKKFVYLCTNGLLLKKLIGDYAASPYLTVSIHLDGNRERHDALACRQGVYDGAIEAIELAIEKGFRVTVNCTFYEGIRAEEASQHLDFVMSMGVEGMTVSPAYSYSSAPQGEIFLSRERSKQLFREVFNLGKGHDWRFNQTNLFLDFLAGNQIYLAVHGEARPEMSSGGKDLVIFCPRVDTLRASRLSWKKQTGIAMARAVIPSAVIACSTAVSKQRQSMTCWHTR